VFDWNGTTSVRQSGWWFFIFAFYSPLSYTVYEMRWCTVTVTDAEGRRHSVDVQATSSFDAAHLFVVEAKKERAIGLPNPTLATVFEVVAGRQDLSRQRSSASAVDCR
jgi:hypothetical protein